MKSGVIVAVLEGGQPIGDVMLAQVDGVGATAVVVDLLAAGAGPVAFVLEVHSTLFAGARVVLAHCTDTDPLIALLRTACQLSLDPSADPALLYEQAADFSGPPLWPALARHVARVSTAEDRDYLEELARNPDQLEDDDVLRWGLKYWVRGDIMLGDDSVLTLDEIWTRQGHDPLPYLEDMPQKLDIDWDEAADDDPEDGSH